EAIEIAADGSLRLMAGADTPFAPRGVFLGGPFEVLDGATPWYRLQVYADPLPDGTHVQLFTFSTDVSDPPPYDPIADVPFPDLGIVPRWKAAPSGVLDILILDAPARFLWIGGLMRSEGEASPVLHQMRVGYGRDTYLTFLPAIYHKNEVQRDFL